MQHTPIGVGLAIFIALALAASIQGADERYRAKCGNEAAAQKESQVANGCGRALAIVGEPKAPPREENPTREQWRQERDLGAQEAMAKWALGSMIAAFAAALATGIGIYFLKQTLDATKTAALAAVEAAKQTARSVGIEIRNQQCVPFIVRIVTKLTYPDDDDPKPSIDITLDAKNIGRGPGILIGWSVTCEAVEALPAIPIYPDSARLRGHVWESGDLYTIPYHADRKTAQHRDRLRRSPLGLFPHGGCAWHNTQDRFRF